MRSTRIRFILLMVAAAVLSLACAAPALASVTWSDYRPGSGATVNPVPSDASVVLVSTTNINKTSARMTVDGATISPLLYLPNSRSGKIFGTMPAAVKQDGPHTVAVSIKDISGVTYQDSWTFRTATPPTLGAPTPSAGTVVRTTAPTIRIPAADNSMIALATALVDGVAAPTLIAQGAVTVLPATTLEDDAVHTVSVTVIDGVGLQATKSWSFQVQVQPEMDVVDCGDCHVDKNVAGHTYNTDCLDCHYTSPHSGTPSAYHPTADVSACRPCHVSSVTVEHQKYGLTCESCHLSPNTSVQAAIDAGLTSCGSCHDTSVGHEAVHVTTVNPSCSGAECHSGTSLTSIHINSGTALSCDSCHKSTNPDVIGAIAANDKDCASCHGSSGHFAQHVTTVDAGCAGQGCHSGDNLTTLHAGTGCAGCHDSTDPDVAAAIAVGGKACADCHNEVGVDYHADIAVKHTSSTTAECFGSGCHAASKDLPSVHALYVGPGSANPSYATTCQLCHANSAVDPSTSGSSCTTACHASAHSGYHEGHAVTTASAACTECHGEDLVVTHKVALPDASRCATCHGNPLNFSKTADCSSCHLSIDHEAAHAVTPDPSCSGCHAGTSLTTVHINATTTLTCGSCHDSVDPAVEGAIAAGDKSCATCHSANPHADLDAKHTATLTQAVMPIVENHTNDQSLDFAYEVPCQMCHASTSLVTLHASDCDACHGGSNPPAQSFVSWSKGCTQGSCHPAVVHNTGPAAHESFVDAGVVPCERCHDPEDWSVPWETCYGCHDTSGDGAPVTTSDVVTSYTGTATIHFSSPGIAYTYYRLDGAPRKGGTTLVVPAPSSGSAAHSLEYWSVDDRTNEETPHKFANFTVSAP